MRRTIAIGSCVTIQGVFVAQITDDMIAVRIGAQTYVGRSIPSAWSRLN